MGELGPAIIGRPLRSGGGSISIEMLSFSFIAFLMASHLCIFTSTYMLLDSQVKLVMYWYSFIVRHFLCVSISDFNSVNTLLSLFTFTWQ